VIAGVKLEVIPVEDPATYADGVGGLDEQQQLFIVSHWAAAILTVEARVRCQELTVTVPVASRLALIACKLHAWLNRRDARAQKRGSDGIDVVRLLETADFESLAAEAHAVDGLAEVVRWAAKTVLIEQAGRVDRMIAVHTDSAKPGADRIEMLGSLLADSLA
jgi:predicted nucleotidyltransferase